MDDGDICICNNNRPRDLQRGDQEDILGAGKKLDKITCESHSMSRVLLTLEGPPHGI